MAQSAVTVTPPNPTPPTNMGFTGSTPPNPANFDPGCYANPPTQTPPYFDDGAAATTAEFVSAHPLLPVGGTSAEHEGRGDNETVVLAPGNIVHTYPILPSGTITMNTSQSYSCGAPRTTNPNGDHASYESQAGRTMVNGRAISSITPKVGPAAGGTAVQIKGLNLTGATGVTFGGTAGTAFSVVNASQINVTTPAKPAGAVTVVVLHAGGNITMTNGFTYT